MEDQKHMHIGSFLVAFLLLGALQLYLASRPTVEPIPMHRIIQLKNVD